MVKVGEHVTLDIIGTNKEYSSSFFEKIIYKISDMKNFNLDNESFFIEFRKKILNE